MPAAAVFTNNSSGSGQTIRITGAGGFIASWIVRLLLERGCTVRGTVRNPDYSKNAHLKELEGAHKRLTLNKVDLLDHESVMEEDPAPEEAVEETEMEEEEHGIDDETANMEPSMNSSAGIVGPHTMKIKGMVGEEELVVLVDCGATHNFISEEAMVRLKLPTEEVPEYTITVADGYRIKKSVKCSNVSMRIQGLEVNQTFYPFPLGEEDAILGVEWLKSLGDVKMNWSQLTMRIGEKGNRVYLRGDPSLTRAETSFNALLRSVQKKEETNLLEYNGFEGEEKTGDHSNYIIGGKADYLPPILTT